MVVALFTSVLLLGAAPNAGGQQTPPAGITDVGWWSQRPGASAAPTGGFEVASGLGGDQSIAALRTTNRGASSTTLVLEEADGEDGGPGALQVCTVTGEWSAANPGSFADAPTFDCEAGSAALERDSASSEWRGEVTSLLAGGASSLMVVPAAQSAAPLPVSTGFVVRFDGARLEVASANPVEGSAPPPAAPTDTPTGSPPIAAPPPSTPSAPLDTPSSSDGGFVTLPNTAAPFEDPGTLPEVAAPPAVQDLAGTPASPAAPLPLSLTESGGDSGAPWARLVVLVPLCAAAGAGAAVGRRRFSPSG